MTYSNDHQIIHSFKDFLKRNSIIFEEDVTLDDGRTSAVFPICIDVDYGKIFVSTADRMVKMDLQGLSESGKYVSYIYPNIDERIYEDEFKEFAEDWSINI